MAKVTKYELKIDTTYLRTEDSKLPDREKDPIEGKCNNFNDRKNGGQPLYIMEHHTASDLPRSLNTFLKGEVSAHYMIDKDGTVYYLVANEYRAYHAGMGLLKYGSKLHHTIPEALLKGSDKEGALGKGLGDMNSWSIGIENVNNGFEPFTAAQTLANLYLHEKIVNEWGTHPKSILSHAEWAPGRKVDPSPYFDWRALATASQHEGIDHDFGVYPTEVSLKKTPSVIASYKSGIKEDIIHLQKQLEELSYSVLEPDDKNLGIYDEKTRDACYSFAIHYLNESITADHEKLALWNLVDYKEATLNTLARGELAAWTENHDAVMIDVLGQYGKG